MGKKSDKTSEAAPAGAMVPTKFAEESAAEAAKVNAPSAAMLALFAAPPQSSIMDSLKRRNLPQMVKAQDGENQIIPVGGIVAGIIVDVVRSPVSTVKGSLLWLHIVSFNDKGQPVKTGTEITFPATGVIRNALAPGIEGEENARKEMLKLKGFLFIAQRQPNKMNKQYKKDMSMWDVRTSDKPVDIGVKIN